MTRKAGDCVGGGVFLISQLQVPWQIMEQSIPSFNEN